MVVRTDHVLFPHILSLPHISPIWLLIILSDFPHLTPDVHCESDDPFSPLYVNPSPDSFLESI